jgi:hypothetical protein
VFRHAGRHYIFASHLTGWDPNPPILHESTAGGMCSTFWRVLPQPSHGTQAGTTYDAQVRGSQQSTPAAAYLAAQPIPQRRLPCHDTDVMSLAAPLAVLLEGLGYPKLVHYACVFPSALFLLPALCLPTSSQPLAHII